MLEMSRRVSASAAGFRFFPAPLEFCITLLNPATDARFAGKFTAIHFAPADVRETDDDVT